MTNAFVVFWLAQSINYHCLFVTWWARKAEYIAQVLRIEEDRWHIMQDGFEPKVYAIIQEIKREAFHDLPALHRRVREACPEEEGT